MAGGPVQHLALTHPADWGASRLGVLLAAGQGLAPRLSTVAEPVGAAAWFAERHELPVGAHLAVLDMGGGTCDAAIVTREPTGLAVTGCAGLPDLGGDELDQRIVERVAGLSQPNPANSVVSMVTATRQRPQEIHMTENPSLLAVTSGGEQWEDPSEDLLYMLLQDLVDDGGGSLRVDSEAGRTMEVSLAGDVFRVRRHDGPDTAPLVATSGELREVHAACTRWAFDLTDADTATMMWGGFDGTLPWQPEPGGH